MTDILFFGQLTDLVGTSQLVMEEVGDTDTLVRLLKEKFPALANAKYMLALDNKMVTENTKIPSGAKVALMPPFSGG
jgi:molybdopterin synthase sulfur carrier subunit